MFGVFYSVHLYMCIRDFFTSYCFMTYLWIHGMYVYVYVCEYACMNSKTVIHPLWGIFSSHAVRWFGVTVTLAHLIIGSCFINVNPVMSSVVRSKSEDYETVLVGKKKHDLEKKSNRCW